MAAGATARSSQTPGLRPAEPAAGRRPIQRDATFVSLTVVHAAALLIAPSIPLIALGQWWNANTIAHNFIHRPFFRRAAANRAFSAFLSLVLGIPQSLWRQRHLQHHAESLDGHPRALIVSRAIVIETVLVLASWVVIASFVPRGFLQVYLPGWLLGMALCQLQGHYEHARGTTSHYGRVYNFLFFNDGYHVEHHQRPAADWRELPALADRSVPGSRWPAVLRWIEWPLAGAKAPAYGDEAPAYGDEAPAYGDKNTVGRPFRAGAPVTAGLEMLERLVLRSSWLQHFVIDRHERAFRALLPSLGPVARITVVGGGLFPRTALILRRLLPHASLTIVDASAANLDAARQFLGDDVTLVHARHDPDDHIEADLVVMPLAYFGNRRRIYEDPPAARVIVHDWIWARHPSTARVSWLLLKRLNLVRPAPKGA